MTALRVLFVASSGELGGAELALATYAAHLPAGVSAGALVLSPGPLAGQLRERLDRPVATAHFDGRPSARAAVAFTRGLVRHLRVARPDVVLATGIKAAVLAAPACRLVGVPLVWHKVDLSHDARLARPLAALTAGVIPVSELAGAAVPPGKRLPVVPPPVRLDPAFRVGPERPPATLGSIGRLVPYKGHALVIEAAARLDARVVIAGADVASAPGHREALRTLAAERGVEAEILEHTASVEAVLERLTVLVGATYVDEQGFGLEGFGLALAEGSWAGLPVVGTSAAAIVDGVTGRVVPPRDVDALTRAIAAYLQDPAAGRAAGARGAEWARATLRPETLAAELVEGLSAAWRRSA